MANQEEMIVNSNNEVGVSNELNYDGSNTTSSLQKNLKLIFIGLAVVVVAIIAVIFYNKSKETKELEASVALSRVMVFVDAGDHDKSFNGDPQKLVRGTPIVGLKTIVDEYGGTRNGEVAAVYAGNALLAKKKFAEAEEYFSKGLSSESKEVVVASNAGVAVCKESKNDYSGAAEQYEKAASMSNQPSVIGKYKLYAAMNYEKANNKEKAEKLYREIILGESPEFVIEAKSGLVRLGMIIE